MLVLAQLKTHYHFPDLPGTRATLENMCFEPRTIGFVEKIEERDVPLHSPPHPADLFL